MTLGATPKPLSSGVPGGHGLRQFRLDRTMARHVKAAALAG